DIDIVNYGAEPAHFQLEIALRSDFADLFEVRSGRIIRRGNTSSVWNARRAELSTTYVNRDFKRALVYRVEHADAQADFANGQVMFDIRVERGRQWHACLNYVLIMGEVLRRPRHSCDPGQESGTELGRLQEEWKARATKLTSSNEDVYRAFTQSVE